MENAFDKRRRPDESKSEFQQGVVDLTIVVPCLNEETNVVEILDNLKDLLITAHFVAEIIIVDDNSDDSTQTLALKWVQSHNHLLRARVVARTLKRRGYGAAVRYGAAHGIGKYCIFVSADAVDPIQLIPELYEAMERGAILAQCSRYMQPGDDRTIPFSYKFFQFFFRFGVFLALGHRIPDTTYAFKMFRRMETLGLGLTQNRFSISPEITFKSILTGGQIAYIPGAQGTRARGESKFKFHKEGIGFGYCLIRAWLHRYNLIYWF